ncbi:protein of unknown function [Mariniphaga anaerophila]|uniref:DUF4290 domain-containing protein n=1 Tax=Mariniphaga anaerophila TaxID=1484053 RepID=A0A1M4XS73_9BACT|nr:DUF4290 domain-containing protein [Mariniphaga anaerophila]SHE96250.1 protein of unknown function [Mariniphaga anaerophila]
MDYNTKRQKLPMPEYGRNIQNMVNHLLTIEDRDKRNKSAQAVIDVMGNLYPYLRDVAEYKHKLWDHLAIMTDFKLDIDYPYQPPSPDILTERPNRVPYCQNDIKLKHYGLIIQKMIDVAIGMEGEEQRILTIQIANQMKKLYLSWNKDSVEDDKIFLDLEELSANKLKAPRDVQLADIKIPTPQPQPKKKKKKNR